MVKNCDLGLENAARGRRPRAAFLVHNHKKAPYSVVVSHGVKFSTLIIFNRPYCSFQHHLDGWVGRRDLAVFLYSKSNNFFENSVMIKISVIWQT